MTTTTKPLSPTQARIMELAARGLRDKEIADTLNMSFSAVRRHWERAFEKLGCRGRTVAVLMAQLHRPVGNSANGKDTNATDARKRAKL